MQFMQFIILILLYINLVNYLASGARVDNNGFDPQLTVAGQTCCVNSGIIAWPYIYACHLDIII